MIAPERKACNRQGEGGGTDAWLMKARSSIINEIKKTKRAALHIYNQSFEMT